MNETKTIQQFFKFEYLVFTLTIIAPHFLVFQETIVSIEIELLINFRGITHLNLWILEDLSFWVLEIAFHLQMSPEVN